MGCAFFVENLEANAKLVLLCKNKELRRTWMDDMFAQIGKNTIKSLIHSLGRKTVLDL